MDEDIENDPPLVPPSADRVWRRAFCLSATICRSFIDEHNRVDECIELNKKIIPWLEACDAVMELEAWEAAALAQPMGTWELQKRVNATWQSEALLPLAWALQRFEIPLHDVAVDPKELTEALEFLEDDAKSVLELSSLRDAETIRAEAERAFAIHWRLRDFSLQKKKMNFAEFADTAWFGPLNIEDVGLIDDDLAIKGVPIVEAQEQDFYHCLSIARERHHGLNWLLGYNPIFSEVDTST